jgi:hypothetical protein
VIDLVFGTEKFLMQILEVVARERPFRSCQLLSSGPNEVILQSVC